MPECSGRVGVVIVGASLAGLRTAQELRAAGFQDPITLIGDEAELPYDRPPLSKQLLTGTKEPADVRLVGREGLADDGIGLLGGRSARAVSGGRVHLDDGEALPYSRLVIATGVSPRPLGGASTSGSGPVHTLRTVRDAIRLRADLDVARHLVIVGAGFIGAEVATAARKRGVDVTVLESLPEPFCRVLGSEVGRRCAQLQRDHGVKLRSAETVTGVEVGEGYARVLLAGGEELVADCVLVAVGTVPNNGWLTSAGAGDPRGVLCDHRGRILAIPDAYAVGDVAAWQDPVDGQHRRFEHWSNAIDQAHAVAATMAGRPGPPGRSAPYFWSDQHGIKIQMVGRPQQAERVQVVEDPARPHRLRARYFDQGRLVAAVAFGAPAWLARHRPLVESAASQDEVDAVIGDPGFARC